jgi:hypothetical protein
MNESCEDITDHSFHHSHFVPRKEGSQRTMQVPLLRIVLKRRPAQKEVVEELKLMPLVSFQATHASM